MSQNSNISYLNFIKKSGISSFLQNKPNIFYNKNTDDDKVIDINFDKVNNIKELELLISKLNTINFQNNPKKYTMGTGNENSKILIIGEFPEEENMKIKSFSDKSEKLLEKMLKSINLNKQDVYMTNIIPWLIDKNKVIENSDILKSLPFIQKQIEIINPKIILLLGHIAAKSILGSNLDFIKLRGYWHKYQSINIANPIKCIVTYHPKHLLKYPKDKKYAWEDLQMFQKKIQYENR